MYLMVQGNQIKILVFDINKTKKLRVFPQSILILNFDFLCFSKLPLSFIIMPIFSSILAVAAFVSALFVFFTYKQHMRGRETASFDFTSQNETCEYKTFWERITDDVLNFLNSVYITSHSNSDTAPLVHNDSTQDHQNTIHI